MPFPAFKEWHAIVGALGAGEQIVILRKGGIAEGRGGFRADQKRFWLFPTHFHGQRAKTKPAAARWFSEEEETPRDAVTLRFFATLERAAFLDDWAAVSRLDAQHFWTEATVRERFEWSRPAGLHVLIVRVHRLDEPVTLPLTPAMAGCKSWIEVAADFDARPSRPVLGNEDFSKKMTALAL